MRILREKQVSDPLNSYLLETRDAARDAKRQSHENVYCKFVQQAADGKATDHELTKAMVAGQSIGVDREGMLRDVQCVKDYNAFLQRHGDAEALGRKLHDAAQKQLANGEKQREAKAALAKLQNDFRLSQIEVAGLHKLRDDLSNLASNRVISGDFNGPTEGVWVQNGFTGKAELVQRPFSRDNYSHFDRLQRDYDMAEARGDRR